MVKSTRHAAATSANRSDRAGENGEPRARSLTAFARSGASTLRDWSPSAARIQVKTIPAMAIVSTTGHT